MWSIEEAIINAGAEDDLQTILLVLEDTSVGFKRCEAAAGPFANMDTTLLTGLSIRMLSVIKRAQQQQQHQAPVWVQAMRFVTHDATDVGLAQLQAYTLMLSRLQVVLGKEVSRDEHIPRLLEIVASSKDIQKNLPEDGASTRGHQYTNNDVQDFVAQCEEAAGFVADADNSADLRRDIAFHLITGGSGSGKTRMGFELRRLVRAKAASENQQAAGNMLWKSAAVYQIDFSGAGDKLCPEDDYIPATCMLGLRLAARNIFCCSLRQLRLQMSPDTERMYTLEGVMAYLAQQKRSEFQLSSTTAVLQVVTVDDVQLITGQTKTLQHASSELPNTMIKVLASWMTAGSRSHVGVTVLMGTGLENVKLGLSGYRKIQRQVKLLTFEQVSSLMCDAIVLRKGLNRAKVSTFLGHPAICGQIKMLMGIPGFMHTALGALYPLLQSVPSTDAEIRQVAAAISNLLRSRLERKLQDDMRALGADFVYRLLLLSLSGLKISPGGDFITPGMTLRDASTVSGMIWTTPCDDGVQAVLPPVVQHYAADFALGNLTSVKPSKRSQQRRRQKDHPQAFVHRPMRSLRRLADPCSIAHPQRISLYTML